MSVKVGIPTLTDMVGPTPFGTRLDPNEHRNCWSHTISVNVGIETCTDMAWPNQISVNVVIQSWFVTGVFGHLQGMNVDRTVLLLALAQGNEWRV
jgi:hypothetical protein